MTINTRSFELEISRNGIYLRLGSATGRGLDLYWCWAKHNRQWVVSRAQQARTE